MAQESTQFRRLRQAPQVSILILNF